MPISVDKKEINRLKVVLAEYSKTNTWLAKKRDKNETAVSRWCTNEVQPSLETFLVIASSLDIEVKDVIKSNK